MSIKLIVGLGNPGATYANTRHNVGAWFVRTLLEYYRCIPRMEKKLQGELSRLDDDGLDCRVFIPSTFMNHSGLAVHAASQFYRLEPSDILVIHDELDLPPGSLKFKRDGGHAGHNGLRNIIQQLGSADFYRLRIGIGHPGQKSQVANYVLHPPSSEEELSIREAIDRGIKRAPELLKGQLDLDMTKL